MNTASEDTRTYQVVVNNEEMYAIWLVGRELPPGWREVGKEGTKEECVDYIKEVWTDWRPLSLRNMMDKTGSSSGNEELPQIEGEESGIV